MYLKSIELDAASVIRARYGHINRKFKYFDYADISIEKLCLVEFERSTHGKLLLHGEIDADQDSEHAFVIDLYHSFEQSKDYCMSDVDFETWVVLEPFATSRHYHGRSTEMRGCRRLSPRPYLVCYSDYVEYEDSTIVYKSVQFSAEDRQVSETIMAILELARE